MVSTRSTKRRSRSPGVILAENRPKKIARKLKNPLEKPKLSFAGVKVILLDIGTLGIPVYRGICG
jgi:hypothetical protein